MQEKKYTSEDLLNDDKAFREAFRAPLEGEKKFSWAESMNYYPGETYEDWEKRMKADCLLSSDLIEKSTQYAYFLGDMMVEIKKETELFV